MRFQFTDQHVVRKSYSIFFFFVLFIVFLAFRFPTIQLTGQSVDKLELTTDTALFRGLCYGPHRPNQDPDFGVQPTPEEMIQDLGFIKHLTYSIRTYGATDNLELIPIICDSFGIDCFPGAWIAKDDCENIRQCDSLISIAKKDLDHVKGLIVGNEVLLRGDQTKEGLIDYIQRVKDSTNLPIACAETWFEWLNDENASLVDAVDILFVHIYPYWDGIAVEESMDYLLDKWNQVQAKYPDKAMILGETGWPSKGEVKGNAVPSGINQQIYLCEFKALAETHDIDYFYFEIFDEDWKQKFEGEAGANWGMYESDGALKPLLEGCVPESALDDSIVRLPGVLDTVIATFPLYVYRDYCNPINKFYSSGWMGDLAAILTDTMNDPLEILNPYYTVYPHSGTSCIRISFTPSDLGWGGIYWQFPINNWGNYPGYDLSGSIGPDTKVRLSFWAKGENGGEKAQFKTGGIFDGSLPYKDSFGPIQYLPAPITLSTDWEYYSIDLTNQNLSNLIGGFVWVTNQIQNPQGATIYLDEIVFEIDYDGDGYFSQEDCDDENQQINPAAQEIPDNGIDEDCDGTDLITGNRQTFPIGISIFPNPFNGNISIASTEHIPVVLQIEDQWGKEILSRKLELNEQSITIELVNIPPGVYFVRILDLKEEKILGVERIIKI